MNETVKRKARGRRERTFGLTVGSAFLMLFALLLWRGRAPLARPVFAGAGALLVLLALAAPRLLALPERVWMRFAEALSVVTTTVILAIVFYLVVTPIGLVKRLAGGGLGVRERRESYWRPYAGRQRDRRHYEKMY